MSIDVSFQLQLKKFATLLNIIQPVKMGLKKMVDVPCMAGCFKPFNLLPFTLTTHLSD